MDLFNQKGIAALNFIGLWIPILRGATFYDVGDIDFLPLKMDGLKDFGQKLASLSYKRLSLNVLFIPRAFTDNHQFCLFVTFSEYKGAPCSVEFASLAVPQLFSNLFQGENLRRRGYTRFHLRKGEGSNSHSLKVFKIRF
jgi:hypothetical protein